MLRYLLLILIFSIFLLPAAAQDEAQSPYEIALQRIQEAEASGATELDLSNLGLTELPPEIGQLQNLTQLYLGYNQLTDLPSEIAQLSNLEELVVEDNQLSSFPASIENLNQLRHLNLADNQISELPSSIGQLRSLTTLNLWGNQLSSLPPEIGQLINLMILHLGANQLTTLPPEIGNLKRLCWLTLSQNQLERLPIELGQLSNLSLHPYGTVYSGLWLDGNPLVFPPVDIIEEGELAILLYLGNTPYNIAYDAIQFAKATNLEYLSLGGKELSELPPEIGELVHLRGLWLGANHLSALPAEFSNLHNLHSLNLSNNDFSDFPMEILSLDLRVLEINDNELKNLPPEIAQLHSLCQLNISNNHIQTLPVELGQVSSLLSWETGCSDLYYGFFFDGNPLISPPQEVLEQGTPAILDYLRNEAWWYMRKLIAGGAGAVGIVAAAILGLRWRNRRRYEKKKKR